MASSGTPITAHSATAVDFADHVLDLRGVDVEAVDDHELLEPVDHEQVAVAVEEADVASSKPAVGIRGFVAVGPVAAEQVGAADQDLARVVGDDVVAEVVDQPQLHTREGAPGRTRLVYRCAECRGHDRSSFGQPVALLDRHIGVSLEGADQG